MQDQHDHTIVKCFIDAEVGSQITVLYITYLSARAVDEGIHKERKMTLVAKDRTRCKIPEHIVGMSVLQLVERLGTKEAKQVYKTECLLIK